MQPFFQTAFEKQGVSVKYSGLNLNQDKATKPQTVQIVRQGEATLYWFLLIHYIIAGYGLPP
ncbi:TPA: hypothetical protein WH765_001100 [Neisseria meningitidis]